MKNKTNIRLNHIGRTDIGQNVQNCSEMSSLISKLLLWSRWSVNISLLTPQKWWFESDAHTPLNPNHIIPQNSEGQAVN